MDRSYLSHAGVVAESRKFVCVRLQTYENSAERSLLKTIFVGRSSDLENTTFSIMNPDGTRNLVQAGRSPKRTFSDGAAMAERMRLIAERFEAEAPRSIPALPYLEDLRLALNVAACDNLPLVVTLRDSAEEHKRIETTLLPLAWSEPLQGRFLYVSAKKDELKGKTDGLLPGSRIVVLDPETFGRTGKILSQLPASADASKLREELHRAGKLHVPDVKDRYEHVRNGGRQGIRWEAELEVTDPGGQGGRRRGGRERGRSTSSRRGERGRSSRDSRDSRGSRGSSQPLLHPLLRAVDANGDGELSAEEIAAAASAIEKLDKNGDGKVSGEELRPIIRRRSN